MRKDVTDDFAVVARILDDAEVLFLALVDAGGPYCVPVNFARQGRALLVHSSRRGRKAAALASGADVGYSAVADMAYRSGPTACKQGYRFRSVIGAGRPRALADGEHLAALRAITAKYAGADNDLPLDAATAAKTAVFAVDITSATARIKD